MLLGKWLAYINEAVRVTYYFRKNDERIESLLYIPEFDKPGAKCHWEIIESADTVNTIPPEEIDKLSPEWRDNFARVGKGLDMRIACDSLSIATIGRIHNFVFMINDRDYLPVLESIKRFGCCTCSLNSPMQIDRNPMKIAFLACGHNVCNCRILQKMMEGGYGRL
jgi:hypothetical protein